jgi:Ulp1 family protease
MVVYPHEGVGAVSITQGDFARLDEGEFLNDTLIEFGLKCVHPLSWAWLGLTHAAQTHLS